MDVGEMQRKLAKWSAEDSDRRFDRILRLVAQKDWLREAARKTLSSPGARTAGIDGVTRIQIESDLEAELDILHRTLLDGSYRPQPVRRIHIPKQNGKLRPLGIPTLRDRIVQRALTMALEPIWESDFHRNSYGFRPRRGVRHAIRTATLQMTDTHRVRKGRWVIEGDLASYFDKVHHRKLVSCVKQRIRDQRLVQLLWRLLRAGHVDKGMLRVSSEGVPQGGVASPLLANIMLNELDQYMEANYLGTKARNRRRGWNRSVKEQTPIAIREQRQLRPCVSYVRYADDFLVIVKGTRKEAEAIREGLRSFLWGELKLTLNLEKTKITHINDGLVFLGHRIIRKPGDRGHWRVVTGIPWKNYRRFAGELKHLLSGNHHINGVDMIKRINRRISGWTGFYRHTIYTGPIYLRVDTLIFWKFAHWVARRYKSNIVQMMCKWYQRSKLRNGVRTWVMHQTINGVRHSAALQKCIHGLKVHRVSGPPKANPYLESSRHGPMHKSYFEVVAISGA